MNSDAQGGTRQKLLKEPRCFCWNEKSVGDEELVLDSVRTEGENVLIKGRERDIDGVRLVGEQKLVKSVKEKERERERERVNTSYCWNAVATRGRKEGGGGGGCACVQGSVGFMLCSRRSSSETR